MSDVRGVWSLQRVRTASHTSQSCRAEGRTAGIHLKGTHRRNRSHRVSYTVQIELVALARVRGKDVLATLCVKLSQKEAALRYLTCGIPSMSSTSMTSMHIISIHFYSFLFHIIWHMIWHMIWMRYDMKSDFHITLHNCIVFGLRVSEVLASSKHLGWWMGRQGVPTSAAWHFDSLWEVFPLCRRYVDRPWRLPHPHRLCGSGWP